jgi:hypothetical protein
VRSRSKVGPRQGLAAGDQREGRGCDLLGGGLDGVVSGAEGAVEHQHGVTMSCRHDGQCEPGCGRFVAVDQFGGRGDKGCADGLCGTSDFGVAILVEPRSGQGLK